MIESQCSFCDDPVTGFVQVKRRWAGTPVLYMGRDSVTNSALGYQFCDADCLLEWLKEVLGED